MNTEMLAARLVPERLFQIVINDEGTVPEPLPGPLSRNIEALKSCYPKAKYHLLGNADVQSLLRANFSVDVCGAYDRLAPYAYKADLARYCVLYALGGLYCDLGIRFVNPFTAPAGMQLAVFRDLPFGAGLLSVSNGLILAAPQRPELKAAIDQVVENCDQRYYGASPLEPTGPSLLGRAIAIQGDTKTCTIGEFRAVTPELPGRKNLVYVTFEGDLVALGKSDQGGHLASLRLAGLNNYNEFWHSRRVYGEEAPTRWRFDSPQIRSQAGTMSDRGIVFGRGTQGCIFYGPYLSTPPGSHQVTLTFEPTTRLVDAVIDIVASGGSETIRILGPDDLLLDERGILRFSFDAPHALSLLEVRLHVRGASQGRFEEIEIIAQ